MKVFTELFTSAIFVDLEEFCLGSGFASTVSTLFNSDLIKVNDNLAYFNFKF